MYCKKCGEEIMENMQFCLNCGEFVADEHRKVNEPNDAKICPKCKKATEFKKEKLIRKKDWIIGLSLLPLFGIGAYYILIIAIVRFIGNKNGSKCTNCGYVVSANDKKIQAVKTIASDKEFQYKVKKVGRALSELDRSLDVKTRY